MIEFLSKWIEGIAIAVIIASILEMLLPNGNTKKYVKVILGIYIVFSIISPFSEYKVKGDFDLSKKIYQLDSDSDQENSSKKAENKLNTIYENTFEKELIKTIEKEGFSVYKCEVKGNFNAEEENAGITKISIIIDSKKIIKKESNKINEIQKVEIKIKDNKHALNDEDVDSKDLDTLRKFLSKHYEIDKSLIDIHIR